MKINLKESLNKIDLATNNKYDLLNTFNSKKLSDNSKKKLAEAIENNSIASINRVLHESEEKVFTVKVYQDYPFVAEVIDNSIIDKNGEGKVLKKFTSRDTLDAFANELISKGYVNYQGYSKNKSLRESEEQLFKVVIQSGAVKRNFESALYEDEAEEIVDYYGGRWIDENGFEWNMYVEEDDDSTEHAMVDNSYDMENDDERAQREMDAYDQSDRDWEYVESLNESSDFAINTFSSFSPEYAKLSAICILLNSMSPNKINYRVEDTYFDYGQDWKWTTIIAHRNNGDSWQAIYPAMQEKILLAGDLDATDTAEFVNDPEFEEIAKDILRKSRLDKGFNESLNESNTGEEDYEEYLSILDGLHNVLIEAGGDGPDDDSGDIQNRSDRRVIYLKFNTSVDKFSNLQYKKIFEAVESYFKNNTEFTNYVDVNIEKLPPQIPQDHTYRIYVSAQTPYKEDESLKEASYGGAYDIEDDMFFTKEEIVDFVDGICTLLNDKFGYQYDIEDVWMDTSTKLHISIYDSTHDFSIDSDFRIDMRRIKRPQDLVIRYTSQVFNVFEKKFEDEYQYYNFDESLKEQINLPGYAVKYTTGYSGNGVNSSKTEWFRTKEERDRRVKELKDKNYIEIKTWKMDNFYHTLPKKECLEESNMSYVKKAFAFDIYKDGDKYVVVNGDGDTVYESDNTLDCLKWAKKNSSKGYDFNNRFDFSRLKESLNEAYEYLYNQPFLKTFDEFVSKVSGLKADELDDEVWNEYFYEYQVYNEKYKVKDFENKLRKSLEEKDLEVISIEPSETATLVTVKFDGKEKKFRFKFRLFDVDDYTEEYYIHYIVSMIAGYFGLNESLKEDYEKLFGYNMLSSTLKDGGDTYALLRKTEDGKTKWAAAKYVNGIPDEDNIFEITYEQARGFEPLTDTGKMSRKLGKTLLPRRENLKEDYDEDVKKVKELIKDANSAFKIATNLIYFIDDNNSLSSLGYEALEMLKDVNKTKYRELLKSISSDIDEEDLRDYGTRDSGILDLLYDSHPIQEYIDSALNYILASKNSKKNDYIKKLASNIIDEVEEDELARFINDDLGDSSDASLKTSDSKSDDNIVYGIKVVFTEDTNDVKKGSWYIKGTGFKPIARDTTLIKDNQRFKHSYLKDKDFLKYYAYKTKKDAIKEVKNMSRYYQNGEDISIVEINLNDIDESLKEDLSDLDLFLNTPADTKQFNDETFKALKNLVSEYKRDLDSLDQWALESEKEPFVKKWYKLADKCKEIAKNGIRGITGYGRLNDAIKLKVVDLARSVDNTFPWYTRNNLAKYNRLESLTEDTSKQNKRSEKKFNSRKDAEEFMKKLPKEAEAKMDYFDHENEDGSVNDWYEVYYWENPLTEDTIKQNGKWVNKGSEGTHGKFRTKKAADAQRKAMFANGYKAESLKEAIDDEIDLDYEADFDDDGVEEGNTFIEGGVKYAWIQREAGPLYLDFDKWAVWSAREYVDPRDFMTIHDNGKGYDFDGDAFKEKAMAAPIVYFVVDEDTGFIDWGPEDNEIAAKDFLNGKKEDWENDMDESLNEDKELNEYYTVNLHYEDVGDGREYDYEADYNDVLEYLMEICIDDDNAPEDTQEYIDWVEVNFDYLLKKYEYKVLNYFEEDASQEEYDRRHSFYEPEYDPMD